MKAAVFLDRDGVINRCLVRNGRPYAPASLADFEILPGVAEAVQKLHRAGFLIVVVTNQPDVGAGAQDRRIVEAMHRELRGTLPIDDIRVCYHVDADGCSCRKPKPGMLIEAAADMNIDLYRSVIVGDRWRDVEAGKAVGCRTVFVDHGYEERRAESPDVVVNSLTEALPRILAMPTLEPSRT